MDDAVRTNPVSKRAVWIACGLIGLGLVASLGIAGVYLVSQTHAPDEGTASTSVNESSQTNAVSAAEKKVPGEASEEPLDQAVRPVAELPVFSPSHFKKMQRRIDTASTNATRFSAVLDSSAYLLRVAPRNTREKRRAMAEEYLVALSDKPLSPPQNNQLAGLLYAAASHKKSSPLFQKADAARQAAGESFTVQTACSRMDALRELGRVPAALSFLEEVRNRAQTAEERVQVIRQEARLLDRALRDEKALTAFSDRGELEADGALRERVGSRLEDLAGQLQADPNHITEGLFYAARVAREQGSAKDERAYLRQVLARGDSRVRWPAANRLAEILRSDTSLADYAGFLTEWMNWDGGRSALESEWMTLLAKEKSVSQLQPVLTVMDAYIADQKKMVHPEVLFAVARQLEKKGLLRMAEKYLENVERWSSDARLLEKALLLQCEIAEQLGGLKKLQKKQIKLITLYPGNPQAADIRFSLFQHKANIPEEEVGLVSDAVGVALRLPRDPRSVDALLAVARRLEEKALYDLAASYYRRASLLGTLQNTQKASDSVAEALLGQARVMVLQGKATEAESVLRSLHTGVRYIRIWDESGPLWASLAFMQGQSREGVRRWRQVCTAPTGELLSFMFNRLLSEQEEIAVRLGAGKTLSPEVTPAIMRRFVRGALETFLNDGDVESAGELLLRARQDPEWKDQLAVEPLSRRFVSRLAQDYDIDLLQSWMDRLEILPEQAGEASWGEWFQTVAGFSDRAAPFELKGENP